MGSRARMQEGWSRKVLCLTEVSQSDSQGSNSAHPHPTARTYLWWILEASKPSPRESTVRYHCESPQGVRGCLSVRVPTPRAGPPVEQLCQLRVEQWGDKPEAQIFLSLCHPSFSTAHGHSVLRIMRKPSGGSEFTNLCSGNRRKRPTTSSQCSDQHQPVLVRSSHWDSRTWMLLTALRVIQIPLVHCQHSEETPHKVREALPAHSVTFKFSQ